MKYKGLYKFVFMLILLSFTQAALAEAYSGIMTKEKQASMTPQEVLERLKEGNQRFISGQMKNRDLGAQASTTTTGQYPVAVILNCMDSRTPPELVFDQGLGDVFAMRIAGNILNNDLLGSMEFGTKLAGAKLIAVIGHTGCGAIRGACQHAKLGHLTGLLQKIQPAIAQASKATDGKRECTRAEFIDQAAKDNVLMVIKQIQTNSPVIKRLIAEGKVGIVGGMQDLATGQVTFFEDASMMPKN
ncbi:carbonic anhydrase family protein [Aquicella lusitana]|uniref:Carbonic anhydrase n=1 Tax=Aquicella lusitana TaxID=254246 RepID=A0A370GE58_9COXI|nr:carbonic anhydrase family protein [Aquicella lusitana]RDI42075.1 carbonic anhydrase [Aquicella lusitana]VVC74418.1 Carbonic anhydrase [Aquicella lusitana]